jgi:hypothetical protein
MVAPGLRPVRDDRSVLGGDPVEQPDDIESLDGVHRFSGPPVAPEMRWREAFAVFVALSSMLPEGVAPPACRLRPWRRPMLVRERIRQIGNSTL